jgi:hypothetical protein
VGDGMHDEVECPVLLVGIYTSRMWRIGFVLDEPVERIAIYCAWSFRRREASRVFRSRDMARMQEEIA